MRGDFVLYEAKPGDFGDWLISHFTKGPYVHVEIDLGGGQFVGEHGAGITVHPIDHTIPSDFISPASSKGPAGIEAGMQWVEKVIAESRNDPKTHTYGWRDIAADAFKLFGQRVILQKKGSWDCSHFVALYLMVAGAAGPLGSMTREPETISPNDLARAFKVIQ